MRSDGTEMVPPDYFDLADQAGGTEALPGWFQGHWSDHQQAAEEWRAYLNGLYVFPPDGSAASTSLSMSWMN